MPEYSTPFIWITKGTPTNALKLTIEFIAINNYFNLMTPRSMQVEEQLSEHPNTLPPRSMTNWYVKILDLKSLL